MAALPATSGSKIDKTQVADRDTSRVAMNYTRRNSYEEAAVLGEARSRIVNLPVETLAVCVLLVAPWAPNDAKRIGLSRMYLRCAWRRIPLSLWL